MRDSRPDAPVSSVVSRGSDVNIRMSKTIKPEVKRNGPHVTQVIDNLEV
jgi:hypothetical protein